MERRHLAGGVVILLGLALAAVQASQALQQSDRVVVLLLDAVPFVLLGLSLTYAGYWLATSPEYETDLPRVAAWGVGGGVLFASVAALLLFGQNVALGTLDRAGYVAVDHVTVGVVVGVTVGLYDARSRKRYRDLLAERDRVEAFANTAADVNNYGRELARSDSLEEVSALCVQAMQVLLGISRTAVLVVDDEASAVEDTLGLPEADTERLAREAADQPRSDVVVREAALDAGPEDLLAVNVGAAAAGRVVLLAVAGPDTDLSETDVQLTEMLLSHAATSVAEAGSPPAAA